MGYISHNAIVVTACSPGMADKARLAAIDMGLNCSTLVGPLINGYASFLVAPDGSKEGWKESDEGDERRTAFTYWLGCHRDQEDKSTPYEWFEVQYGSDDKGARIVEHAWMRGLPRNA